MRSPLLALRSNDLLGVVAKRRAAGKRQRSSRDAQRLRVVEIQYMVHAALVDQERPSRAAMLK